MFYKGSALRPFTTCLSPALSPLIPCLLSTVLSQKRLKSPPQKLFKKRTKTKQNQECGHKASTEFKSGDLQWLAKVFVFELSHI